MGKCGSKDFPSIYARVENEQVLDFIKEASTSETFLLMYCILYDMTSTSQENANSALEGDEVVLGEDSSSSSRDMEESFSLWEKVDALEIELDGKADKRELKEALQEVKAQLVLDRAERKAKAEVSKVNS